MAIIAALPQPVAGACLHYLALFRPESGRALTPAKAQRLLAELQELTERRIVAVAGRVARPCPPNLWAAAMEQMVDRRVQLRVPLANHNYLRQIAWGLADAADAAAETKRNEAERSGNYTRPAAEPEKPDFSGLTAAELRRLPAHIKQKYGIGDEHAEPS